MALHPHFPLSYAPGCVVRCKPNDWFRIRFYDKEEANVQRQEVIKNMSLVNILLYSIAVGKALKGLAFYSPRQLAGNFMAIL